MNNYGRNRIKNRPRLAAVISSCLFLVFVFIIFLPYITGLEGMNGGFAISVIAAFLAIMCLITAAVYYRMSQKLKKIISGEGLILHWSYEKSQWQKFSDKEYKFEKRSKLMLLALVAVIALVIFSAFAVINPETAPVMMASAFGLVALLSIFAFLVPWLNFRSRKNSTGELYLSNNGLYLGGLFHTWGFLGSKLESAVFNENEMLITLEYSYPTRTGTSVETVHVPVPPFKSTEAQEAVKKLIRFPD